MSSPVSSLIHSHYLPASSLAMGCRLAMGVMSALLSSALALGKPAQAHHSFTFNGSKYWCAGQSHDDHENNSCYFGGLNLGSVPEDLLSGLTNLESVDMAESNITSLPKSLFSELSNLEKIYLDSNSLSSVPEGLLRGLSNMKRFGLEYNNLTSLPENLFSDSSNLSILNLSNNKLTSLSENLFSGLSNLERIYLNDNDLTTLPADLLRGLSSLKDIDLRNNDLISFPKDFFSNLPNLKNVYIEDNNLSCKPELPPNVNLDVSDSQLPVCEYKIVLSDKDLTSVSKDLFSNHPSLSEVTEIYLDNNDLTSLPADLFHDLPKLQKVDLNRNLITSLPADIFSNNKDLKEIYIYYNRLSSVPVNLFSGLSNLEIIYMGGNLLKSIPEDLFSGLTNLKQIALDSNYYGMDTLPEDLFSGLNSLEEIYIQSNDMTVIPEGLFSGLSNLKIVMLDFNDLTTLPENLFHGLPSLKTVSLGYNQLTCKPMVESGVRLQWESSNQSLPVCRSQLALSNKSLTSISTDLFSSYPYLPEVKELYLDNNSLTNLPVDLFNNFSKLQKLYLNNNDLSSLPAGIFSNNQNLKEIYLHNNNLDGIPASLFTGLSSLEKVYMYGNNLGEISEALFSDLTNLKEIALDNNNLNNLPTDIFTDLTSLGQVNLSSNNLGEVPEGLFNGLSNLEQVFLDHNNLSTLPRNLFSGLSKLESVGLLGNNLTCKPFVQSYVSLALDQDKQSLPICHNVLTILSLTPDIISTSGSSNVASVTATFSKALSESITITVSARPIEPAGANDFTLSSNNTLTIAAGETTSTGTVTITAAVDGDPSIPSKEVIVLGSIANTQNQNVSAFARNKLTITNREDYEILPVIHVSVEPNTISEGHGPQTLTVTASLEDNATLTFAQTITLYIGLKNDEAQEGVDYTPVEDLIVTLNPGENSVSTDFILEAIPDDIYEMYGEVLTVFGTVENSDAYKYDDISVGHGSALGARGSRLLISSVKPATVTIMDSELRENADDQLQAKMHLEEVNQQFLPSIFNQVTRRNVMALNDRFDNISLGSRPILGKITTDNMIRRVANYLTRYRNDLHTNSFTWDWKQAFSGTQFSFSPSSIHLAQDKDNSHNDSSLPSSLSIWGDFDYSSLRDRISNTRLNGDIVSFNLGADIKPRHDLVTGLNLSLNNSEFDLTGNLDGMYKVNILTVNPYVSWSASDDLSLWATLGYGIGQTDFEDENTNNISVNKNGDFTTFSAGGRFQFWHSNSGTSLVFKLDGSTSQFLEMDVQSGRLGAEISHNFSLGQKSSVLRTSLEMGLLMSDVTDSGLELVGDLNWYGNNGFSISGKGHVLIDGGDQQYWGVSTGLRYKAGRGREGLMISLEPSAGTSSPLLLPDLWTLSGPDLDRGSSRSNSTELRAEVAYGFASGSGFLRPYASYSISEYSNTTGAGIRYSNNSGLSLNLKASHRNRKNRSGERRIHLQLRTAL